MPEENIEAESAEPEILNPQFNLFGETHTDDLQVLDYLLRNIKGLSPVAGEPVDGVPDVDDIIKSLNS